MKTINDRLDSPLPQVEADKTPNAQIDSVARTGEKPGFVENRACARCIGECKIF